jgi:predicted neutral ceramidase superfamily lipid hydrolase
MERTPSITDYLAAATLSYGTIFFWLKLSTIIQLHWLLSYMIFYLGGVGTTYLVCHRTDRNQFPVAIKSALFSWVFTLVCMITFTQGNPSSFFKMLLVLFLLGGITSSVISMRERLRPKKPEQEH